MAVNQNHSNLSHQSAILLYWKRQIESSGDWLMRASVSDQFVVGPKFEGPPKCQYEVITKSL